VSGAPFKPAFGLSGDLVLLAHALMRTLMRFR
jgi:hypothetical protein